jgi:hypothetical protein
MPPIGSANEQQPSVGAEDATDTVSFVHPSRRKDPQRALTPNPAMTDPLLTVEDVRRRLNVSKDWVWDHCSRKKPSLPFIRMGDGALSFAPAPSRPSSTSVNGYLRYTLGADIERKIEAPTTPFPHRNENLMGKTNQAGWVGLRGKKWYGYFRRTVLDPETEQPKTDIVCVPLGLKTQVTKSAAREKLRMEVAKHTGQNLAGGRLLKDGATTFEWFVRNRYFPLRQGTGAPKRLKKRWPRLKSI